MTAAQRLHPVSGRRQLTGLYLTFVGLGATGAVIPAAIPVLAQLLDVPTAALLPAVPALFTGLFSGVALAPLAARRIGAGRTVGAGALLQALALLLLAAAATTGVVLAAAATAGVGFGIAESGGTALTRRLQQTTSRTLTGLTAAAAAAAALTPLAVVATGPHATRFVLGAAALPHVLATGALGGPGDPPARRPAAPAVTRRAPATRWLGVAVFCYVGSETVIAGWSATLARATFDLSPATAALGTSAFWALLMIGRLAAAALMRRGATPRAVLTACQVGAGTTLAIAAAATPAATALSAALIGVSVALMGPCYALLLGQGIDTVADVSTSATAAELVAVGALGGAAWAAAVASTPAPLQPIAVTAAACLAMTTSGVTARAGSRLASSATTEPGDT